MNDELQHGKVKWFNTNKGFGFILSENNEDIFVHYTDILNEGFRNLSEGEEVNYKIVKTAKGMRAVDVRREDD